MLRENTRGRAAAEVVDLKLEHRRRALAAADALMQKAKARFSLAALACLRGAIDAPTMVQKALAEVEAARAALRELADA